MLSVLRNCSPAIRQRRKRLATTSTEASARVKDDPKRAAVFVSALEQAEELMRAATDVGPTASPLPLFYAVSQAGRAITAARWMIRGVSQVMA